MMSKTILSGSGALLALLCIAPVEAAEPSREGSFSGATSELTSVNYYFNRDFRSGTGQGKREEWAQGFILDVKSGWTAGPVGVGLDVLGFADFKLDGLDSEAGSGILPTDANGARKAFGRLAPTLKAKLGASELYVGTLMPKEPLIGTNTSRLLPQTFNGAMVRSRGIEGLDVFFARYTSSWYRDGVDKVPMTLVNKNGRFKGTPSSDHFDLFSAQYQLTPRLTVRYQSGLLEHVYHQQLLNAVDQVDVGQGRLKTELRYYVTEDSGRALAGPIKNEMYDVRLSYAWKAHEVAASGQWLTGPNAMPFIGGTDGDMFNWVFNNDFLEAKQRSWLVRYRFDGASIGLNGWSFMARYVNADHARPATISGEGREWERNVQVAYQFQDPRLKGLSVRWVNGMFRSNFQRSADENRLILQYKLDLMPGQ